MKIHHPLKEDGCTLFKKIIEKKYPDLKISVIDYGYNKFKIVSEYKRDFKEIKNFDSGNIELIFSISNSKTDKTKKNHKGKKRYVQTQKENPIKFVEASLNSYTAKFDWFEENNSLDARITHKGYKSGERVFLKKKDKKNKYK